MVYFKPPEFLETPIYHVQFCTIHHIPYLVCNILYAILGPLIFGGCDNFEAAVALVVCFVELHPSGTAGDRRQEIG